MEPLAFFDLVKQYGPWVLGWVFFLIEYNRNNKRDEREIARAERWATLLEGLSNKLDRS